MECTIIFELFDDYSTIQIFFLLSQPQTVAVMNVSVKRIILSRQTQINCCSFVQHQPIHACVKVKLTNANHKTVSSICFTNTNLGSIRVVPLSETGGKPKLVQGLSSLRAGKNQQSKTFTNYDM